MKKFYALLCALALVFTAFSVSVPAAGTCGEVLDNVLPTFEKESSSGHIIDNGDGSFKFFATPNADGSGGDTELNTYNLWSDANGNGQWDEGENLDYTNFLWEFDYNQNNTDWGVNRFYFRSNEESVWSGYQLMFSGNLVPQHEHPTAKNIALIRGDKLDEPYNSVDFTWDAAVTYRVKILVVGHNVNVWVYDKTTECPHTPTISCQLPYGTDPEEYVDFYVESGSFQYYSWGGRTTLSNMSITCLDSVTSLDNVLPTFEKESSSGHIIDNGDGSFKFFATPNADGSGGDTELNTYNLWSDANGNGQWDEGENLDYTNFLWEFDYNQNNTDWGVNRFYFRSNEESVWSGYQLMFSGNLVPQHEHPTAKNIALIRGDKLDESYNSVDFTWDAAVTYRVKILVVGHNVNVWVYDKTTECPHTPTISCQLPYGTDPEEYVDFYVESGSFQYYSWGGRTTLSNMSILNLDTQPEEDDENNSSSSETASASDNNSSTPTNNGNADTGDTGRAYFLLLAIASVCGVFMVLNKGKSRKN